MVLYVKVCWQVEWKWPLIPNQPYQGAQERVFLMRKPLTALSNEEAFACPFPLQAGAVGAYARKASNVAGAGWSAGKSMNGWDVLVIVIAASITASFSG